MWLPPGFVRKHRHLLPEMAKLRIRSGKSWTVKIEKAADDEDCFFTEGWSDFVKDLGLHRIQMLVFWLNVDEGTFDVSVYDPDSNQRHFSAGGEKSEFMDGNTSQRLSSVLLNELNYLPWSRAITIALGGKAKLSFIQDDNKKPEASDKAFDAWVAQDQLVMSWLLNSMEPKIAEIFSYSESSNELWKSVKDMYGDLNNAARIFQLKKELGAMQQGSSSFVQHLGILKSKWNELNNLRPHTTDATILLKRSEEDKIFQLLASLGPEYEDLRSHLLMSHELPTLSVICSIVQREEVRKKVMNTDANSGSSEPRAFAAARPYNGRRPDLKCSHCEQIGRSGIGHIKEKCWILHPELKPKFNEDHRNKKGYVQRNFNSSHAKANICSTSEDLLKFTANPITLINEFAAFIQQKHGSMEGDSTALLGKFAGFMTESESVAPGDIPGMICALSTALHMSKNHDFWIVDSGASDHMTNDNSFLNNFEPFSKPSPVTIANGSNVQVLGKGKYKMFSDWKESPILYIPSFPFKLLSVGRLTRSLYCQAIFSPHDVIFQDYVTKKKIGEGFYLNGLYYISTSSSLSKSFFVDSTSQQLLWHKRLAHPSFPVLTKLFPDLCKTSKDCEICHMSKSSRLPFPVSQSRSSQPFEIVHSDVWGPAPLESFDGYRFYVIFIDDFTRTTFLYLLKCKSEVFKFFQDFHNMVKNQFSSNIKTFRSDNGTEFTSNFMKTYLSEQGIIHQTSCVGTPQQNGIAERKNRDLLEKCRAIMLQNFVPKRFWSQAMQTAAYLINRLPSSALKFQSPLETLKGRKIDLSHLKIFGCVCYVHVQANNRDKFDARAVRCMFIGYSSTQKGYKCYNPKSRKVIVSRDIRFDEGESFFKKSDHESHGEFLCDFFPTPVSLEDAHIHYDHSPLHDDSADDNAVEVDNPVSTELVENDQESVLPSQPRRNPSRERRLPGRLQGYETYTPRHPASQFVSSKLYSPAYCAFMSQILREPEPRNFEEARKLPVWKRAMDDELKALNDNQTWSIVTLPQGQRVVGSRWIYKIKYHADGSIERHKARLVARGFTQTYGIDYKETFAPVAKMNTVRVLLSVAVNRGWHLCQMDVKNAFLHGDLENDVYMRLPPGHPREKEPGLVCKLHKALYGLKQSSRAWYSKLSNVLFSSGFERSNGDHSMFVRSGKLSKLVVLVYVDDLIIAGEDMAEICALKEALHKRFAIKDLGALRFFLGIEMDQTETGMFLSQRKYVVDLLDDAGMKDSKPVSSPLDSKLKLDVESTLLQDVCMYQRLVGKLIYLTITRPDISFAVSLVSQFMHSPTEHHLQIVKRLLRYLKGTISLGIAMKKRGYFSLEGYCDSDWAGNHLDRRSTTGYCTFVGGNLVTWKSKKQSVVARSSAEAEYRAMASTACELIWLKIVLKDLGISSTAPILLHCDNQAAMHIAANPVFHERTKHIEVDCHFVRNQVQSKVIETVYTRSSDQLADLFTKPLAFAQFERLLSKLGSRNQLDPA